jgi:hypothetical protein
MVNSEELILRLLDYGAVALIAIIILVRIENKLIIMIEKLSRIEAKLELLANPNPKERRGEGHV